MIATRNHPRLNPLPAYRDRGHARLRRHAGFTFIEILSVVILLGITASIVVPQFSTRDDLQTTAAARLVMADLMYAQNRAIATQKKHFVEFAGSSYTLYERDSDTTALYTLSHPLTNSTYTVSFGTGSGNFSTTQIASINFDGSAVHAIQFDSLGLPSIYNPITDSAVTMANTGVITLATTSGAFPTVVAIDPVDGEATVQP